MLTFNVSDLPAFSAGWAQIEMHAPVMFFKEPGVYKLSYKIENDNNETITETRYMGEVDTIEIPSFEEIVELLGGEENVTDDQMCNYGFGIQSDGLSFGYTENEWDLYVRIV